VNQGYIKQLFYTVLLIFSITCLFSACKKRDIIPNNSTLDTNTAAIDSIAKLDSLPSFNSPAGVAVDAAGNIYVADYGNNLIRKITPAGVVSTFAGSGNQGITDGAGTLASFDAPTGITADASGNLYVADAGNNLIRKITPAGVVSTIAGSDTTGSVNGIGNAASFYDPLSVAVDGSGNLYVADAGNDEIRKITSGGTVTTFAANDTSSTASSLPVGVFFNNPTGVTLDASGNVYVANYLNNTILIINPAGTTSIFAGSASGQQGSANGPAASATFYFPNSVAADASGNVYVADGINNLIRKITSGGIVSTFAGDGLAGAVDSTGTNASFNGPAGLAVDAAGNVYVADSDNNLIRKITPAGVVTTIAGNGQQGAKNGIAIAHRNKKLIKINSKNTLNLLYRPKRN